MNDDGDGDSDGGGSGQGAAVESRSLREAVSPGGCNLWATSIVTIVEMDIFQY